MGPKDFRFMMQVLSAVEAGGETLVRFLAGITTSSAEFAELVRICERLADQIQMNADRHSENVEIKRQLMHAAKMSSLGVMASGMAHEIRNPLMAITGFTQLIIAQPDHKQSVLQRANSIAKSAAKMNKIIDHLRAYSHLGESGSEKEPLDINSPIRDALVLLGPVIQEAEISCTLNLAADLPQIHGDSVAIESAVQNLITNSRDAFIDGNIMTPRSVSISTELRDDAIGITYRDTAGGMPKHIAARIFDPFFTTKKRGKGTGLGMAIVQSTISDHGGKIIVSTQIGQGTTFEILLPIAFNSGKASDPRDLSPQIIRDAEKGGREENARPRLLLIDEDESMLELLAELLASEFVIYTENNLSGALDTLRSNAIDIVLADCPSSYRGLETSFFEKIVDGTKGRVPIASLSADILKSKFDQQILLDAGVIDLIEKPLHDASQLSSRLLKLYAQNRGQANEQVDNRYSMRRSA